MGATIKGRLLQSAACASLLCVAACGGGSGVGGTPTPPVAVTPTPTPTPAPAPTPTPTPTSSFDTTEYRATVGAVSANALTAYNRGSTGQGVTVGVVDSGIDLDSAEFGSRVLAASANVAGGTTVDDEGGHGTAVAFTIAGRRNDAGTHGIAFAANLIIARADSPGSCATTSGTTTESGCSFADSAIGRGIDLAVANGARVINISLGGSAAGSPVVNAINRATAAGIIVVISAGNDYDTDPVNAVNPDPFAQVADNAAVARGLVIIAGSVGANDSRTPGADVISTFSNRAGTSAAHYLTAVGERVRAPDQNGAPFLWTGTSFSAPQIAGAVALLAQAFPTLTGAQIVSILYSSARDAGATGVDSVYGQGVLDLTRAFLPLGTSSVAGTTSVVSFGSNGVLSAAMGDARQGTLGAVILDGYSRAFAVDLAGTIGRASPARMLGASLQNRTRTVSAGVGGNTSVALTIAPVRVPGGAGGASVSPVMLSSGQAIQARAIAGTVVRRLGGKASFAFGFAEGGATLTARLSGRRDPAFLVAPDPTGTMGFDAGIRGSTALRQEVGGIGVTAAIENGDVLSRDPEALIAIRNRFRRFGYNRASIALDRQFGGLRLGLTGTQLVEQSTILGAHFGDALGATRATTWFLDGAARWDFGHGWTLGGSLRQGWTNADVRGGITGGGLIRTNAFAADIGKDGVFARGDSIGLRVAQPLRVARGGIDLRLPSDYDYDTLAVTAWTTQRLNLAPTGRELDVEARYDRPLWGGALQTNLFLRRQPGNVADYGDDVGAALRWSVAF